MTQRATYQVPTKGLWSYITPSVLRIALSKIPAESEAL